MEARVVIFSFELGYSVWMKMQGTCNKILLSIFGMSRFRIPLFRYCISATSRALTRSQTR